MAFEQDDLSPDHARIDSTAVEPSSGLAGARQMAFGSPAQSDKVGPASLYPNANLTPGDELPVTKEQVCTPGYTKTVRDVTPSERAQVFSEYGIPYVRGKYEVDHFVSLELGGSNDIKNLWPEPYLPRPGARQKDVVENYLHRQICKGSMTLPEAQEAIKADWYAIYENIHGN